jgi:hypothetical protein
VPGDGFFFVVGCPRSGTTLLSVLLDRHSRLSVPPETGFFDEIGLRVWIPSRRYALHRLRRWRRLPELQLTAEEIVERLPGAPAREEVLAAILRLYAQRQGKSRAGEKTPQHLRHVPRLVASFPSAPILCLLRDGRDVALSLAAMPWFRGDLARAASLWKRAVRRMDAFALRYPGRFHVVRYEALVTDPAATLATTMAFLGEAPEPRQLSAEVSSGVVLKRALHWKGEALEPPTPEAIGRRRRASATDEIRFLEEALGPQLRAHGYLR